MLLKKITLFPFKICKSLRMSSNNKCLICSEYHVVTFKLTSPVIKNSSRWFSFNNSVENTHDDGHDTSIENKIIYNSITNKLGFIELKRLEKRDRKRLMRLHSSHDCIPVSLKYITSSEDTLVSPLVKDENSNSEYNVQLPYKLKSAERSIFLKENEKIRTSNEASQTDLNTDFKDLIIDRPSGFIGNWMNDYEKFSGVTADEDEVELWRQAYGTPDTSQPISDVPCGGCGALIHCQDPSIPGYLPSEIYKNCSKRDLRETVCQRCHFLKNYNTALSVAVDPEDYPRIISRIRDTKSLVILIADMADLPCSIWPGILDLIGRSKPIFLVGNKIDLIPGDRKGWMQSAQSYLRSCLPKNAPILQTALVSAKTGFGVEELIDKLLSFWQYKGDVYLVGCANVGKSTLFNALLQSDYCKVKAVDLIQRATIAPWPGTTLNLLKFPILKPEGWRLYLRIQRLIKERHKAGVEKRLIKEQKVDKSAYPQLISFIGRTFAPQKNEEMVAHDFSSGKPVRFGLDPNDPDFKFSKWVYDTPGVLTKEQFLDLLTTEEILLTVPKEVIHPRSFVMKVGWTLFIAGIARMDYISGNRNIKVTLFSAPALPVTIVPIEHAENVYCTLLGTEAFLVPTGQEERLKIWPGLKMAEEFCLIGIDKQESCADITLSSAGWVSVTPFQNELIKMSFWTPEGRGVHVRSPSLLPKAIALRGKKKGSLPVYGRSRPFIS